MASEMAELYWQALLVDTPFRRYETDPMVAAACRDLTSLSAVQMLYGSGGVTPQTLFRGRAAGDLSGPYISQLAGYPVRQQGR
jgi:hypothetical protein